MLQFNDLSFFFIIAIIFSLYENILYKNLQKSKLNVFVIFGRKTVTH